MNDTLAPIQSVGRACRHEGSRTTPDGFEVSEKAAKRVKDPLPPPTECRYCESPVRLACNDEIYGRPYGTWPLAYLCTNSACRAYVGVHPKTDIPLGTLADRNLRQARRVCKESFERLRSTAAIGNRTRAYAWLAEKMELPPEQCHWAMFEINQCREAREICEAELEKVLA